MQIDKGLQKLGGRLEVKTLNDFNSMNEEDKDAIDEDFTVESDDSSQPEQKKTINKRMNRTSGKSVCSQRSAKSKRSARSR
jgi:hypothetical protein